VSNVVDLNSRRAAAEIEKLRKMLGDDPQLTFQITMSETEWTDFAGALLELDYVFDLALASPDLDADDEEHVNIVLREGLRGGYDSARRIYEALGHDASLKDVLSDLRDDDDDDD
jgi:hypothetical protein